MCSIIPTLLEHKRSKWHIVELSFSKKSFTPYFTHNTKTTLNQLHLQLLPCKYSLISLSTFSLCLSALNSSYPRTHFKSHGQSHLLYGWKISQGLCWIQHFIADINKLVGDSLSNDIESLSVVVIGSIWLHLFQLLLPGNGVKSPQ